MKCHLTQLSKQHNLNIKIISDVICSLTNARNIQIKNSNLAKWNLIGLICLKKSLVNLCSQMMMTIIASNNDYFNLLIINSINGNFN
jgi:hypothetical protein